MVYIDIRYHEAANITCKARQHHSLKNSEENMFSYGNINKYQLILFEMEC